jgi:predicted Zn-dependent peptidase
MQVLFRQHEIRTPILGDRESIRAITAQTLTDYHRAFYTPQNMMLCVMGDMDPESVCAAAREVLGSEKGLDAGKMPCPVEDMDVGNAYVSEEMEVAAPMFQLAFKAEPTGKGEPAIRTEIVGDLVAEALMGESSALYLDLYERGLIDASFGGGFETVEGCAMLTASGDSDDPKTVRDAIFNAAAQLLREGIPEDQFLRMKRSALGRRVRDLDSWSGTCFRLCAYAMSDFDYFRFPELYQQIGSEEVLAFLKRVVRPERCALSVIEPMKEDHDESQ